MSVNMKLAAKGRAEPLTGLRDQAGYHLGLVKKHTVLGNHGWKPEHTTALETGLAAINTQRAGQLDSRDAVRTATSEEGTAVTTAKAFKHKLGLALDDIYADAADSGTTPPVGRGAFETGRLGTLKRNTSRIVSYLEDIRPSVEKMEEQLKPYFDGASPLTALDEAKSSLSGKQAIQETGLAALPADTLQVYEAKGKVLTLIEKANRIGKLAYAGDAVSAAVFNKDLLLRARAKRQAKDDGAGGGGSPA